MGMKFLVLAACVAASSAQGFYGLQTFPNGAVVPVDEPAVAAARADHLALKGAIAPVDAVAPAVAAAPALGYAAAPVAYAGYAPYAAGYAPYAAGYAAYAPYAYGYAGPLNLNTQLIAHPNGA